MHPNFHHAAKRGFHCTGEGSRTPTLSRALEPKSSVTANSTTPACAVFPAVNS